MTDTNATIPSASISIDELWSEVEGNDTAFITNVTTAFGITDTPPFSALTEETQSLIREILRAAAAASFTNCLNEEMMCTIIDKTAAAINLFSFARFFIEAYDLADYGPSPIISSKIRQAIKDRCRHPGPAIKWKISRLNREQIESLLHFIMKYKDDGLSLAFNASFIHAIRKQHIVNDGILLMAMGICLRRANKEIMPIPMPMLADLGKYGIGSIIASMGDDEMPTDSAAGALLSFMLGLADDEDEDEDEEGRCPYGCPGGSHGLN